MQVPGAFKCGLSQHLDYRASRRGVVPVAVPICQLLRALKEEFCVVLSGRHVDNAIVEGCDRGIGDVFESCASTVVFTAGVR